jgi:hypothetical protein
MRRHRVDVGEVSRKGCRFESREPFDIGDVGIMSVIIDGRVHIEVFRVSRTATMPGSECMFEAGVEFLPMPAHVPSLHDIGADLDDSYSS